MILQSNDMTSLFRTWTQEGIIVAGGFDTCIGSYMPIRHSGLVLRFPRPSEYTLSFAQFQDGT